MEATCADIAKVFDSRALYVMQPLGAPPSVETVDFMDRMQMHLQKRSSVLNGDFSCCRMNHQVKTPAGHCVPIPCDKDRLRVVLEDALDRRLAALGPMARANYTQMPHYYAKVGASFKDQLKPFFNYMSLNVLKNHILASDPNETAEEVASWPQDADGIAPEDAAVEYGTKYGYTLEQFRADPMAPMCFLTAVEGNLPMLRYAPIVHVLVQHSSSLDKFSRLTALNWLHTFIQGGREHIMPFCAQEAGDVGRCREI